MPGRVFNVPNPKLSADPSKVTYHNLYSYRSPLDARRVAIMKNFKGALPMMGGIFGAAFLYSMIFENSQEYFFGTNGQGGQVLTMISSNSTFDMAYNREFQRMCYLSQGQTMGDTANHVSNETLKALGGNVSVGGSDAFVHKKSPHFKYF